MNNPPCGTGFQPVSETHPRRVAQILPQGGMLAILAIVCLCLPGCFQDAGTGGTGELVVPNHELRQVDSLDLRSSVATTQSTRPATQPAGPPPPEVSLAIEDCRRMALTNNLDLQVQLFTPAIVHTQVTAAEGSSKRSLSQI